MFVHLVEYTPINKSGPAMNVIPLPLPTLWSNFSNHPGLPTAIHPIHNRGVLFMKNGKQKPLQALHLQGVY